ncbi:MAG: SIS domain-containing protein [Candidatus Limnocylindria bacterium]
MTAISAMERTMLGQPDALARILADDGSVDAAAERIRGRRVWLVGTGTSWHAASLGAFWLRVARLDAIAVQAADAALYGPPAAKDEAVIVISHRGTKAYTSRVLDDARAQGVPSVLISRIGMAGADLETVESEISSAHTASYTGSLLRLAQLAVALGADLGPLADVPAAVAAAMRGPSPALPPPERSLEYVGAGPNQWTAAEGALKVRETAYVAAAGYSFEQFLHGPSVSLGDKDALVCLDGGGPGSERLREIATAAERSGIRVHRFAENALGEPLSVFPLTVVVQRVALECAAALGTDPDSFGLDRPGHRETWGAIAL